MAPLMARGRCLRALVLVALVAGIVTVRDENENLVTLDVENASAEQAEGSHPTSPEDESSTAVDKAVKVEKWGDNCYGKWTAWTECDEMCYKNRTFFLEKAEDCTEEPYVNESVVYKICKKGKCLLAGEDNNQFMKDARETIFRTGFHSGIITALGDATAHVQIYVQLMLVTVIIVLALVQSLQINWMPDIAVAIPVAAGFAMVFRFVVLNGVDFGPAANEIFGVVVCRLMNDVLIPISLFEGAYHVQQKNFWSQFGYGLLFAVVGTGLSAVFIAVMVKKSGEYGLHPVAGWRESFAYAAFIADVDPVATLSIFSNLKVDALLSTLVAGEATLNDPIALVIFNVCNKKAKTMDFDIAEESVNGAILLVGSIVLGVFVGLVLSVSIKVFRIRSKGPLEASYVLLSAFSSFCIGEFVGMSGIIVALFCGLIMGVYARDCVEDNSSVDGFVFNAARLADIVMFVIIGFGTFLINDPVGVKLGLLTIVFCFIARALMILILVPLVNLVKKLRGYETVNVGTAFMMFHSGLRGGMTVMMALMVDSYWSEHQNILLNATIVTVIGMTYLCGCTGPFFLRLCGVPMNVPQEDGSLADESSLTVSFLVQADSQIRDVFDLNKEPDDGEEEDQKQDGKENDKESTNQAATKADEKTQSATSSSSKSK